MNQLQTVKPSLRHRPAGRKLYWTGEAAAYVHGKGISGATILLYHGAGPELRLDRSRQRHAPEHFEADAFLSRPTGESMSELVESTSHRNSSLHGGDHLRRWVSTIWKWLADSCQIRLPATHIATNAINDGHLWVDELYTMFRRRTRDSRRWIIARCAEPTLRMLRAVARS
jgi:hypothetical protein